MLKKKTKASSNTLEVQNAVKTMFANIRFASVDNPIQSIVVTSSVPNEGKTTSTIELAKSIAASGSTVLLVEADMRRRSVAAALGVHVTYGAYAVMSNQVRLQDAVVSGGASNFYFLDSEPNIPNPADIISSRAFAHLIDEACEAYDYVLFDTPPVGTFVDAALISHLVDGAIMVVKVGGAKRDEIQAAYEQLKKADAHVIGVCATFCEGTESEYYYEYYTKDKQRIDSSKISKKQPAEPKIPTIPRGNRSSAPNRVGSGSGLTNKVDAKGNISNSQAWKRSAVQAGVQQARHSNTPRVDRSRRKH